MKPGHSRLLINDFLLPNTGAALIPASLDFLMMSLSGAERTERQWRELLDSIGLKVLKIWSIPQSAEVVIERGFER